MKVGFLDWSIVALYFLASLLIGLYYSRRAGKNTTEFFGAGRSLTWWLAGTSMVATTFSSDTPLAVTEMVYKHGVAGNWLWWNFVFSGMLTVFFYARLWRRVGVLTDIEFTELRYGGKPAAFLRGFRALYLGILINAVIMGWVNSAMATIINVSLGIDRWKSIAVCLVITVIYSSLSGLWGVVVTDFFQFIMAMAGCVALSIYGVRAVGGMSGMQRAADRARRLSGKSQRIPLRAPAGGQGRMARAHAVLHLHRSAMVGVLVSGRGAWRGRLCCAAHVQRQGRKEFPACDPLVQHRALLLAALAVDSDRAGRGDPLSQPPEPARRICDDDDSLPSARNARADVRGHGRGLHVHRVHPHQLGDSRMWCGIFTRGL